MSQDRLSLANRISRAKLVSLSSAHRLSQHPQKHKLEPLGGLPDYPVDPSRIVSSAALSARLAGTVDRDFRRGLWLMILVLGLGGAAAGFMPFSGAVVAPGTVVTVSGLQKIQHPSGGIVREIFVHDGSKVAGGQLLVKLDATVADTNFKVVAQQLDEAQIRASRLAAERDGLLTFSVPTSIADRGADGDVQKLLAAESALFMSRARAQTANGEIIKSRLTQLDREVLGLIAQIKSSDAQLTLASAELKGIETLYRQSLVALPRLSAAKRDIARLSVERLQLVTALEDRRAKIGETRNEAIHSLETFRIEAAHELREAQAHEAELTQRYRAGLDQLTRTQVVAPVAGIVHQLNVRTPGGVIAGGETLMLIVPDGDALQIETRVQAKEIDQITLHQHVDIRLSGLDRSQTPTLQGVVGHIAADAVRESPTTQPGYLVLVSISGEQRDQLGPIHLQPGMPAEVFFKTKSRTLLSYLFKPLTDQWQRVLRER